MKRTVPRTQTGQALGHPPSPTGFTPVEPCLALPDVPAPIEPQALASGLRARIHPATKAHPWLTHRLLAANIESKSKTGSAPKPEASAYGSIRGGFSLIEVILATAILLGSVFVLSELANIGRRQSHRADLQSQAQELCERTLNEILSGEREPTDVDNEPLLPANADQAELEDLSEQLIDEEEELLIFETPEEQALLATGGELTESDWLHSVRIVPLPDMPGLAAVTVSVKQSDEQLRRPVRFSLTRWLEAPNALGNGTDSFESASPDFGFSLGADR